jgi:preprotein translocase subunit SecG
LSTAFLVIRGLAIFAALIFTFLVFVTGKGDAMSGSGSIRTTFKGKASIDDLIGRLTLGIGVSFMVLMLILAALSERAS